jgi:chromosome segregation ATPase
MSWNNLEDLETQYAPLFFVKSAVDEEHFRYMFWVGPENIEQARNLKARCNADTTRRHVDLNQAAQEMYTVDSPFADEDHENFYQYCIGKLTEADIQYLFDDAENMYKRWEQVEADLVLAEKDYKRYIYEQDIVADKEKVKQFLINIEEHNTKNNASIDDQITELERKRERLRLEYETRKRQLQESLERIEQAEERVKSVTEEGESLPKQLRSRGLYCAHCLKLKKGGGGSLFMTG